MESATAIAPMGNSTNEWYSISHKNSSSDYLAQLHALQRVRQLAGQSAVCLRLPQIVVVGDQSSGKSSVLSGLTNVHFPVKAGICTKAPIVLECKRDEAANEDSYWLCDDSVYCKVDSLQSLSEKITNLQNRTLADTHKKISTSEILVKVCGPDQMDAVVVDLPGIINVGEGKDETRELIERYVSKPETLVLLVSEAKQDDELVTARELVLKWDPEKKRTKWILTKFDTFDSEDSRARAVKLVNSPLDAGTSSNSGWSGCESEDSNLLNSCSPDCRVDLAMAPHAVITAPSGKAELYSPKKEMELLQENGVTNLSAAGIPALKQFLPDIYARLIKTNLPALRESVQKTADAAKVELKKLGLDPACGRSMIRACQEAFEKSLPALEEAVSRPQLAFQEKVHATQNRLTKDWSAEKLNPNVFECPLFLGKEALRACMLDIVKWWKPLLDTLQKQVGKLLREFVAKALQTAFDQGDEGPSSCFVPKHLRECLQRKWVSRLEGDVLPRLELGCQQILDREVDFGTMNHYLTSSFAADRVFPEECMENFLRSITEHDFKKSSPGPYFQKSLASDSVTLQQTATYTEVKVGVLKDFPQIIATLRRKIQDQKTLYEKQFQAKSLHEQQQDRLHDAVKALWKVEHKTTIDLVLKELRATPFCLLRTWVSAELWTDTEIHDNAVEEAETARRRKTLQETLERMDGCENELKKLF